MGIFGSGASSDVTKMLAEKDVKGLVKALKHKDVNIRTAAAKALGKICDESAAYPIIAALCNTSAVAPLIAALKDKEKGVRIAAANALSDIGDKRALDPLMAARDRARDRSIASNEVNALRLAIIKMKPRPKKGLRNKDKKNPD